MEAKEGELSLLPAINKVADGKVGGLVEHARTSIAHHLVHLLAHVGLVAVYGALGAYGLVCAEFTVVNSLGCVLEERGAVGTEVLGATMMVSAVEADHYGDGALFAEEVHRGRWLMGDVVEE